MTAVDPLSDKTLKLLLQKYRLEIITVIIIGIILCSLLMSTPQQVFNDGFHRRCRINLLSISNAISDYEKDPANSIPDQEKTIPIFIISTKELLKQFDDGNFSSTFWEMNFWEHLHYKNEGESDYIGVSPYETRLVRKYCQISDDTIQNIAFSGSFRHNKRTATKLIFIPCLIKEAITGEEDEALNTFPSFQERPFIVLFPFLLNDDSFEKDQTEFNKENPPWLKYGVVPYQSIIKATEEAGLPVFHALLGNGRKMAIHADGMFDKENE